MLSDGLGFTGYTVAVTITTSSSPEPDLVPVGVLRFWDEVLTATGAMDTPVPVGAVRN